MLEGSHGRKPKQERAQTSLDRMLGAAETLLMERTSGDLTIAEVSAAAGVPVGSIYFRFKDKEELLRAVQQRIGQRLAAEHGNLVATAEAHGTGLEMRAIALVDALAEFLLRESAAIQAMIAIATRNAALVPAGRAVQADLVEKLVGCLMGCRGEIRHPQPETAVRMAVRMLYATFARQIGIARPGPAGDPADWAELKLYSAQMVLGLLLWDRGFPDKDGPG
ncbi:AcrR family transcriptional regulator [Sphingomonas zeicaulis]|uniref:TetR/AcrR family transcriptional regulator n=1 Tax=Sphingomonas zeicaulis TaxID=1632740 RepID=UPI003D237E17